MKILPKIHDFLWGAPLIVFILFVGIVLSIKLKGLQIRKLPKAFSFMLQKETPDAKRVSSFEALCISLSATLGTGNITGVATAITLGGVGALLWMEIGAILGMVVKYAESFLAIKYRYIKDDLIIGGPFIYIEKGLKRNGKKLAISFATFGMLASILGMGTFIQINGISDAFRNIFTIDFTINLPYLNLEISIFQLIIGAVFATLCGFVLIGGIKKISKLCEILVPFMAFLYITLCLIIIVCKLNKIPYFLNVLISMAKSKKAMIGGIIASFNTLAIKQGISKGLFSNEAGMGSSPIAVANVKGHDPIKEGLLGMMSTFLGTIVICTLTGLVIILTSAYQQKLEGIYITEYAFTKGLPFPSIITMLLLLVCITCFAFTTMIGWHLYGIKCLNYLTNNNQRVAKIYNVIYIIMIFIGAFLKITFIWDLTEILCALMSIPNLIAILSLSDVIKEETNQYFLKQKD